VAYRELFRWGAVGWMDAARPAALDCHVPAEQIHLERFTY
jgi:ferredoxin-NADP reductase